MDNFKKMIGEMKQAEQKEEGAAAKPQPKVGAPAPKPQQPQKPKSAKPGGNRYAILGIPSNALTYEGEEEPDISWLGNRYGIDFSHTDSGGYAVEGSKEAIEKFYGDHYLGDYGLKSVPAEGKVMMKTAPLQQPQTQKPEKKSVQEIIDSWAAGGFDEKTAPYKSDWGKGVFHQGKSGYTINPEETYERPLAIPFDFGSASKKKSMEALNKELSQHGLVARNKYQDDDSGNDYVILERKEDADRANAEAAFNEEVLNFSDELAENGKAVTKNPKIAEMYKRSNRPEVSFSVQENKDGSWTIYRKSQLRLPSQQPKMNQGSPREVIAELGNDETLEVPEGKFDRFEKDIAKAKTQSEFDRIKEEVDAAFENNEINSDQKDALYDKIPAELEPLPLFGERAMRAIDRSKRKSPSSDVKRKVEGILGRKFNDEEWAEIVRLAKEIR